MSAWNGRAVGSWVVVAVEGLGEECRVEYIVCVWGFPSESLHGWHAFGEYVVVVHLGDAGEKVLPQ